MAELSIESRAPDREMSSSTAGIDSLMETGRSISLRGELRFSWFMFHRRFDSDLFSQSQKMLV